MAATNNNTTIIPALLAGWLQLLAPGHCFEEFFVHFNFFDVPCLKIFISKCLGYAIICGSFIVKVPQIVKIWKAKSGAGINLVSVTIELVAISATWAYGAGHKFPFSSYGEALFLAVQTSTIAFLVYYYNGKPGSGLLYVSVYVACMAFLLSPATPMSLLTVLQAGNIFMASISKLIQAWENFQNSSTGQLSVITVYMLFLGSCARIFTSIQETGDAMVIANYSLSSICNCIIAVQFVYYWNSEDHKKKSDVTKKKL